MLKDDLEALTGKLLEGDLTPIVIDLLKGTRCKKDLLNFGNFCRDRQLVEKIEGGMEIAARSNKSSATVQDNSGGLSLSEWVSKHGINVPL